MSLTPSYPCVFQFVQVVWRPLVTTMVTAVMARLVQERVFATKASKAKPVNCVTPAIMAPTVQVAINRKHTVLFVFSLG